MLQKQGVVMFTSNSNTTQTGNTMKLFVLLITLIMVFALFSTLFADNKQSNTNTSSNSNYSSKSSNNNSNDTEKSKIEDKKKEKEEKKAAKAQEKAAKKEKKYQKQYYDEPKENTVEKQDKIEKKDSYYEQNTSNPEQHINTHSNNTQIQSGHGVTGIVPQSSDKVEQHPGGGLIPDATEQHGGGGNHSPNEPGHDWDGNHGNHNHEFIGHDGYFHDAHQHDFFFRRNHWHDHYPFFSFRLGFDLDSHFPYNDLYYYPTDYVLVESRLSVVVLPFRYADDEDRISSEITDKMISALDDLHRFRVIDRWTVRRIMSRNDITESDLIDPYPAKRLGRLAEADLVISGTIEKSSDHITLSVKCMDPDTGETVVSETATSEYTDIRNLDRLIKYLAVLIYNDVPLAEGRVTDIEENELELNFGSNDGIQLGTRCIIYREGPEVRHPYTGEYLGQRYKKVAEVFIVDLRDDSATARIIKKKGRIRIGDQIIVK
jgi:TolB-like protein